MATSRSGIPPLRAGLFDGRERCRSKRYDDFESGGDHIGRAAAPMVAG